MNYYNTRIQYKILINNNSSAAAAVNFNDKTRTTTARLIIYAHGTLFGSTYACIKLYPLYVCIHRITAQITPHYVEIVIDCARARLSLIILFRVLRGTTTTTAANENMMSNSTATNEYNIL